MDILNLKFLRSFRIMGFALFDFAAAFGGMYVAGRQLGRPFELMLLTLPTGYAVHKLFGIQTPLTQMIDSKFKLKLLLLGLVVFFLAITSKTSSNGTS